jgi:diamine N-acetyltransferase
MITIRIANPADADLIADMSHQTFYESFAADNSKEDMDKFFTHQFSKEMLRNEVITEGNIFLLAYDDEIPVGYARLRENNIPPELEISEALEIARIYAVKSSIGKGIGRELMRACIDIANEKKHKTIWLGVWENNRRAIDFYAKWGFVKFSEHPFILGNDVQTDWLLKKEL